MADWMDCPNGCGDQCKGTWVFPHEPSALEAYMIPRTGDFHLNYACPGSFESGLAVAFGILGMCEALKERSHG